MDRQQFESELDEILDDLYRLGVWMSKDPNLAEDLVQEATLKGFRSRSSFREGGNFKAWMSKILSNSYIDRYRKKKRRAHTTDFEQYEPAFEELEEPAYFAVDELDKWQEHVDDVVKESIQELSDTFRIPFLLFSLCNLQYKEIAEMLEIPLGTVMSRLYRARKQLKSSLRTYARSVGFLSGAGESEQES